jgi:hypothetical protein
LKLCPRGLTVSWLAFVKFFFERDFARAGQELKNAIALNPNYATAYQAHSVPLGAMKRYDESVAEARRASKWIPFHSSQQHRGRID